MYLYKIFKKTGISTCVKIKRRQIYIKMKSKKGLIICTRQKNEAEKRDNKVKRNKKRRMKSKRSRRKNKILSFA